MKRTLAGHAFQVAGYGLCFLGLGVAVAAFLVAGCFPTVPLWVFVASAMALGAPVMIAGGRINSRGRGLVLGQTPAEAAREHRRTTILMLLLLLFLLAHSAFITAPVLLWAIGLVQPHPMLVRVWVGGSMLVLCLGRDWISRPLWDVLERQVTGRPGRAARSGAQRSSGNVIQCLPIGARLHIEPRCDSARSREMVIARKTEIVQ
jgi:hypothetical protein